MLVVDKLLFSKFEHNLTLIIKVNITESEYLETLKQNNCEFHFTNESLANKQKILPVKEIPTLPLDEEFIYIEKIGRNVYYFRLRLR